MRCANEFIVTIIAENGTESHLHISSLDSTIKCHSPYIYYSSENKQNSESWCFCFCFCMAREMAQRRHWTRNDHDDMKNDIRKADGEKVGMS